VIDRQYLLDNDLSFPLVGNPSLDGSSDQGKIPDKPE